MSGAGNRPRTSLITGGNGNLGRLVAERLLARGENVVKFDIPGSEPEHVSDGETIVIGDIRDHAQLRDIYETHKPDCLFHLASLLSGSSEADPEAAWEINATGSFRLLQLAKEFETGVVFFASTIASFGEGLPDPLPDDAPQWPANIYGATKVAVERLGVYFKQKHGMDFRALRFPLVFSPFAPPSAVTAYPSHAFKAACAGDNFTFPVSPETGMSSMLLDDVITGIVKFTDADKASLTQHVYSLHAYFVSAQQVADEIERRVPGFSYTFEPEPTVDKLLSDWPDVIQDQTARNDWGWDPAYDFKKSADYLMDFYKRA